MADAQAESRAVDEIAAAIGGLDILEVRAALPHLRRPDAARVLNVAGGRWVDGAQRGAAGRKPRRLTPA